MGLLFTHHKKFGGFSKMVVGCVPRISYSSSRFLFRNGSHNLSMTFVDISM